MCLAVPGEVLSIEGSDPLARTGRVAFAGIVKQVSLALVPDVSVGDYVLVHAGFAITLVDEEAARRSLALLAEIETGEGAS